MTKKKLNKVSNSTRFGSCLQLNNNNSNNNDNNDNNNTNNNNNNHHDNNPVVSNCGYFSSEYLGMLNRLRDVIC